MVNASNWSESDESLWPVPDALLRPVALLSPVSSAYSQRSVLVVAVEERLQFRMVAVKVKERNTQTDGEREGERE